ncbi:unnamed protein product [Schistosoma margrebowiei]|uniref:Uncharacterized protein n=1 Tax=Schistosoma margrebowiei TaxID=48269 RepID=A0A183LQH6_9TREM|nr:unnamed protein product [Schistosoma margrebowiei]
MGPSILQEQMVYEPDVGHRLPWDCISLRCSTALWIRPSGRRLRFIPLATTTTTTTTTTTNNNNNNNNNNTSTTTNNKLWNLIH